MNQDGRGVGVLLGAFLILSVLVIAAFFVDFGRQAGLVYILFILELSFLIDIATQKNLAPLGAIPPIARYCLFRASVASWGLNPRPLGRFPFGLPVLCFSFSRPPRDESSRYFEWVVRARLRPPGIWRRSRHKNVSRIST